MLGLIRPKFLDQRRLEFSGIVREAGWLRLPNSLARSARYFRSRHVAETHCSLYANPPSFRGRPQGSGTNAGSGTPLGSAR